MSRCIRAPRLDRALHARRAHQSLDRRDQLRARGALGAGAVSSGALLAERACSAAAPGRASCIPSRAGHGASSFLFLRRERVAATTACSSATGSGCGSTATWSNNREERLPEVGRYNAGQKLLFFLVVVCLTGLLVSGIVIWRAYFATLLLRRPDPPRLAAARHVRLRADLRHHRAHLRRHLGQGLGARHDARHGDAGLGVEASSRLVPRDHEPCSAILDPAQIEAFAERSIPAHPAAGRASVFRARAQRLRALGAPAAHRPLRSATTCELMARARRRAAGRPRQLDAPLPRSLRELERSRTPHGMPLIQAAGVAARAALAWHRSHELCERVAGDSGFPGRRPRAICARLRDLHAAMARGAGRAHCWQRRAGADRRRGALRHGRAAGLLDSVLASRSERCEVIAERRGPGRVPGVRHAAGRERRARRPRSRATVTCTAPVRDRMAPGARRRAASARRPRASPTTRSRAARRRCAPRPASSCRSYRKILYQEKDPAVEPVADDLASLALDLLMGEEGYQRASGNPLLWQRPDAGERVDRRRAAR